MTVSGQMGMPASCKSQSTYRGIVEIRGMYQPSQLERTLFVTVDTV